MKKTKFGGALPQKDWIQKYHRTDPNKDIPFVEEMEILESRASKQALAFLLFLCFLIGVLA